MRTATTIAQMAVRLAAVIQLILGIIIWLGNDAPKLVHIVVGIVLVLGLWTLAVIGRSAGVDGRLVGLALVWGALAIAFGLTQEQILKGDVHLVIEVLHLVVGVAAVGMAEGLAARIKRARPAGAPPAGAAA